MRKPPVCPADDFHGRIYFHPTWDVHWAGSFAADIQEMRSFDDDFAHTVQAPIQQPRAPVGSFPSRLYDGPLPNRYHTGPIADFYAISVASLACFKKTPDRVRHPD